MAKSTRKHTTLYAPDGREYVASSPAEVTRLKAQGYTETKPKGSTSRSTSTSSTSGSSS